MTNNTNRAPRLLREFCCAFNSRLGTPPCFVKNRRVHPLRSAAYFPCNPLPDLEFGDRVWGMGDGG
jgi:hypothetical protein